MIAGGLRRDIAAGTAVRFEPGQIRDVQLVALAGKKHSSTALPRRRDGRRCDACSTSAWRLQLATVADAMPARADYGMARCDRHAHVASRTAHRAGDAVVRDRIALGRRRCRPLARD